MSRSLAAIVGGAAGGLALLVVLVWFLWRRFLLCKALRNKNSETGSSDPSTVSKHHIFEICVKIVQNLKFFFLGGLNLTSFS